MTVRLKCPATSSLCCQQLRQPALCGCLSERILCLGFEQAIPVTPRHCTMRAMDQEIPGGLNLA